jgi:hypothetical protein
MAETSDCHANAPAPIDTAAWLTPVLAGLFIIGYTAGSIFVRSVPIAARFDPVRTQYDLWAAVVGSLCGYALSAALYFGCAVVGIARIGARVRMAPLAVACAAVLLALVAVFAVFSIAEAHRPPSTDSRLASQTWQISIGVAICASPGLLGFLMVRMIAVDNESWMEDGFCRMRLVMRVRMELRRLLNVLGAFLTLIVIATGLRRRALLSLDPHAALPSDAVLLYGLVFAVLIALFFISASSALDVRAAQIVDEFAPLPQPDVPELSDALSRRNDLAALVGLGGSWRTFQAVVVVAAPLLTALIASATGT